MSAVQFAYREARSAFRLYFQPLHWISHAVRKPRDPVAFGAADSHLPEHKERVAGYIESVFWTVTLMSVLIASLYYAMQGTTSRQPMQLWILVLNLALMHGLCFVFVRRHLIQKLPFLGLYVLLNPAVADYLWLIYTFDSPRYAKHFWISREFLALCQWVAAWEICRRLLRNFRGIRALVWRSLLFANLFAGLVVLPIEIGRGATLTSAMLELQRCLTLTVMLMLTVSLFVVRYFGICVEHAEFLSAIGLASYSAVSILGDALYWISPSLQQVSTMMSVVILAFWCMGLFFGRSFRIRRFRNSRQKTGDLSDVDVLLFESEALALAKRLPL